MSGAELVLNAAHNLLEATGRKWHRVNGGTPSLWCRVREEDGVAHGVTVHVLPGTDGLRCCYMFGGFNRASYTIHMASRLVCGEHVPAARALFMQWVHVSLLRAEGMFPLAAEWDALRVLLESRGYKERDGKWVLEWRSGSGSGVEVAFDQVKGTSKVKTVRVNRATDAVVTTHASTNLGEPVVPATMELVLRGEKDLLDHG